jgi:hypothetical protein
MQFQRSESGRDGWHSWHIYQLVHLGQAASGLAEYFSPVLQWWRNNSAGLLSDNVPGIEVKNVEAL